MDRRDLLEQLDRLTGALAASPHTPPGELERLRQVVGRELQAGPAGTAAPAPRIFRRDTAFRSGLLGGSVPEWGAGMAPSASFGPFVDEQGLSVWLDLFQPTRLVSLTTGTGAAPQPLTAETAAPATPLIKITPVHYLMPLPPGLHAESPELFGFFTYEFRVGHTNRIWCTAQGRFGHPTRLSGVQHPRPAAQSVGGAHAELHARDGPTCNCGVRRPQRDEPAT